MKPNQLLCGMSDRHICDWLSGHCGIHRDVVLPLQQLQHAAAGAGFDLQVASGFRSFTRQLTIWNGKAGGQRPVLGEDGHVIDLGLLSDVDKVFAILRWSALPGASRHHWGTDVDVFDAAAVPENYPLQLTGAEYQSGGPFADFSDWLEQRIAAKEAFGFVRPYGADRGGVAPEPWHLSYGPLSCHYQQQLDVDALREVVTTSEMLLKPTVLEHLDEIFARFIAVPLEIYPL